MLDLAPTDDYAHYGLARALEKLGRTDEARGHLKLAKSLRPGASTTPPGCGHSSALESRRSARRRRAGDGRRRGGRRDRARPLSLARSRARRQRRDRGAARGAHRSAAHLR